MIPKNQEARFETTTICNYKCFFCKNQTLKRKKEIMSLDLFKKLFDKIFSGTNQYTAVSFVGIGEPLIDKELEKKIAYARKEYPNLFIPVTTNGYLLTSSRFKSLVQAGINLIRVSFQGISPQSYAKASGSKVENFYRVKKNVLRNSKIRGKIILVITLILPNEREMRLLEYWKKMWKDNCDVIEIWTPHNTADHFSFRKIQKHRKKTCGLVFNGPLIIYVDGRINVCCMDVQGQYIIGDLKTQSLKEIFNSSTFKKISKYHKTGNFKGSGLICDNCDQRNWDKSEALVYNSQFNNYKDRIDKGSPTFQSLMGKKRGRNGRRGKFN